MKTDTKSSGLAFPILGGKNGAKRSLVLSPVLVGTAGQAIDDPMVAVLELRSCRISTVWLGTSDRAE
jgi:hypothetical protein